MAPKRNFLLKDSDPELIEKAGDGVKPKGRMYSSRLSQQPGGIRAGDLVLGMKLASLAITDDKPNTLRIVSKTNPWQKEALKMITGSKEEAYKPLSTILSKHFDLKLDAHIDVSGIHRGRPLDTQGYIAHNDEMIVLSYRCTTSALDWITNLSTTSSEWEPDVDIALGHAGCCSCLLGHEFCAGSNTLVKPRVHTGFYNNFLYTTPLIMKHIEPLLQPDQPPRKLYVVGHSLGAGIATLAACYFLLNFDWELLPHKLVCVTAGSPRAVQQSMADAIHARLNDLEPFNKASFCRIVLNEDVVTKVPPSFLGYVHLDNLVYITEEGEILIKPDPNHALETDEKKAVEDVCEYDPYASLKEEQRTTDDSNFSEAESTDSSPSNPKYERMLKLIPTALKDHMPDFYLRPLIQLFEREQQGSNIQFSYSR